MRKSGGALHTSSWFKLYAVCALAIVALTINANAAILVDDFACSFPDDPTGELHDWIFTYEDNGTVTKTSDDYYQLLLDETITTINLDSVEMSGFSTAEASAGGSTPSPNRFRVRKRVQNQNGHAWDGYIITLESSDGVFDLSVPPTSDKFTVVDASETQIIFSSPEIVQVGEEVELVFDIILSTVGEFTMCMHQQAVPEPATLGLLAIGSGLVFLKRRK